MLFIYQERYSVHEQIPVCHLDSKSGLVTKYSVLLSNSVWVQQVNTALGGWGAGGAAPRPSNAHQAGAKSNI